MKKLTVKGRKVELNGNEMSGDTYAIKEWIKKYLNGKWNADKKCWIVDLGQVETWTGTCIQIDTTTAVDTTKTSKRENWYVNTKYGRELAEDY